MKLRLTIFMLALLAGGMLSPHMALAQPVEYDMRIGRETAIEVSRQIGIVDMPGATAFLDSLGERLVKQLGPQPFDYTFFIVDMDEPNAFALPGGYVFVSRGLLWLVNTEDQLAGVIGHEIIHAHRRHSVKSQRRGIFPALLQLPGAIATGIFGEDLGKVINTPFEMGGKAFMASYGRKQERESDRLGIQLAAAAGYDPEQLADMLLQISREVEMLTGEKEKFNYFNDHPLTPERVDDIRRRSQKLERYDTPPLSTDQEALYRRLEGLLIGSDPAQGLFRDSLFLHPDLDLAFAFPPGWKKVTSPVMVGAFEPGEKAQLLLSIAGEAGSPEQYGSEFIQMLAEKYQTRPTEARKVEANGHAGYLVSLIDSSSANPMAIHVLWMNWGNVALQFMAVGYEAYRETLKESILSIRPLSEEEKSSFTQVAMRIAVAREGESLQALAERTQCEFKPEIIALLNGLQPDAVLREGQVLKVAVKEPYQPPK